MDHGNDGWSAVLDLAAGQHGYFTRAQAAAFHLSDITLGRATRSGRLRRVQHGVYQVQGSGDLRWEDVWVAWLRLGPNLPAFERARKPDAIAAGLTAAWVYGIGDMQPEPMEFLVDQRRQSRLELRLRVTHCHSDDWEVFEGLPLQRVHKIVADLVAAHADEGHVVDLAIDALGKGLIDIADIEHALGSIEQQSPRAKNVFDVIAQQSHSDLNQTERKLK